VHNSRLHKRPENFGLASQRFASSSFRSNQLYSNNNRSSKSSWACNSGAERKIEGILGESASSDGSITDFAAVLLREVTIEEVNEAMKKASETYLKGIMEYSTDPLVSTDIVGNPHSCIFDSSLTDVQAIL
jgi:hypothetical protein